MTFSVTCSNCDRRFVDIDDSLIGQHAKCRCGSTVELQPVWDFKKSKTSRRPAVRRRPAPAKPATAVEPSKRSSRVAAKPTKPQPAANHSSAARPKKRKPEPPQRADIRAATVAPPKPTESKTADTKTKADHGVETAFDNYGDLDQILAAGIDRTPLEPTRVDSPFSPPVESAKPSRLGIVGSVIGGLSGLLVAFVLLLTRVASLEGTPMGWTGGALYGAYTASVGSGEMNPTCTGLFIGLGWWILLLGVLTGIASALLLIRVVIRITAGRKTLAWTRGLLATLTVVCLFSLMGLLFVQTIHHGNLIRDLDSFSNSAPTIEGLLEPADEIETFQDVRESYESENTDFMIGVLTFAVLPLISFTGVAASLLFDER